MVELKKQIIHPEIIKEVADDIKIVYSPFNGTGNVPVRRVLSELGFKNVFVVPEQEMPDPNFTTLDYPNPGKLFAGIDEGAFVYFVHSYYLQAKEASMVRATTEYGVTIHASVERDHVFACQFHPEKSSSVGLTILNNFAHFEEEN